MEFNGENISNKEKKTESLTIICLLYSIKISLFLISIFITYLIARYYLNNSSYLIKLQKKYDYKNKKFAILQRLECPQCGFFSFYIVHLGCMNKYLNLGYIPIIDLKFFPNVYNGNDTKKNNPWEIFFYQPYNHTLDDVIKYAKNVEYYECTAGEYRPDEINMYYNKDSIKFWHDFAEKYMPLKNEIINEVNDIMKNMFNDSNNVLGVKIRGTDYIAVKPKGHSIPPKVEEVIKDVKKMDKKNKYDWIFFSTEDELIRKKFVKSFDSKLKLLEPDIKIDYNYDATDFINLNKNINGNINYIKNYVLNTIILSKCLDIVTVRCSGTAGIYILTEGFRNALVYNLGEY